MAKKVYVAGFDLFAADGAVRCSRLHDLCVRYGLDPFVPGFSPGASGITDDNAAPMRAEDIFRADITAIDACDVVMANLNPYRGFEPDSGTAFEVGYAFAKGIPVYGYLTDDRPMRDIIGSDVDENGYKVEDFDSPLNLMLSCSCVRVITGDAQSCLRAMQEDGVMD